MDLERSAALMKVLADPTRVRLLVLLEQEELTVAELSLITHLAQPRVSTHLAKLKKHDLVQDRRSGVSSYYRYGGQSNSIDGAKLWHTLRAGTDDPLINQDLERLPEVLKARAGEQNWADAVAGDMERHYSPGRTWEATARAAVQLLDLGLVMDLASGDGVLAELLAPRSRHVTCVDASEKVVAACKKRLSHLANVLVEHGDMHALPDADSSFDLIVFNQGLTYTENPDQVFSEISRLLRPGGKLLLTTLKKHAHANHVRPFGHANLGFEADELLALCQRNSLNEISCVVSSREQKPPNFEILTLLAKKLDD